MYLGDERTDALQSLVEVWDRVREEYRPQLVSITGEPGFGKTRLVQEFYRHVMSTSNANGFWPAAIITDASDDLNDALRDARKAVRPIDFTPPSGVEPDVIWVGALLSDIDGRPGDTGLETVIDQVSSALSAALLRRDKTVFTRRMFYKLAALLPLGELMEIGVTSGEILTEFARLFRRTSSSGYIGEHANFEEKLAAFARTVVDLWGFDGLDGPPAVIVIEDAHVAQTPTISLIQQILANASLPFLIILCSQSQQLRASQPMTDLLTSQAARTTDILVGPLGVDDLQRMLRHRLPRTAASKVRALAVRADGNPYHAQLLLLDVAERIDDGDLTMTEEEIGQLNSGFDTILERLWNKIPAAERRSLAALAAVGHEAPHEIDQAVTLELALDLPAGIGSGWLKQSTLSRSFLEYARWEVVRRRAGPTFTSAERHRILETSLRSLEPMVERAAELPEDLRPLLRRCIAQIATDAIRQRVIPTSTSLARELVTWAESVRWDQDWGAAIAIVDVADGLIEMMDVSDEVIALRLEGSRVRSNATRLKYTAGSVEAVAVADAGLELARRYPERVDDLVCALLQVSRAHRIARGAEVPGDDHIAASRAALREARRVWRTGDRSNLHVLRDLQTATYPFYARDGKRAKAARAAKKSMKLSRKILGPHHPYTLEALTNRAYYLRRLDRRRGVEANREILAVRREIWGDVGNPRTAAAMQNLAAALLGLEDEASYAEARELAEAAAASMEAYWGSHHIRPARLHGIAAAARVGLSRFRPDERDRLRREALELAEASYRLQRELRPKQALWPIRGHLAEARAVSGDAAAVDDFLTVLREREDGVPDPERRAETRWAAERIVRLLREYDRVPEAEALARRYRLDEPDAVVLDHEGD